MTSAVERAVAAIGPDRFLGSLTTQEQQALAYQWRLWARPSQLPPPGEWLTWLVLAGRGYGKTVRTIRDLLADSDTVVTSGTSYENKANLAPAFFHQVKRRYEGTRRGQQEIMGFPRSHLGL